ncbi:hypothetical protein [Pedobacter sp. WC2423]|uniref:hypothetical protein n=1 Tax=Pedobacter sp. WC2423 TaxID=3234142 RepID=UPI0034651772
MDRLNELDEIYNSSTQWMIENPNAPLEEWLSEQNKRITALKEQTEIFKQQLLNIKNYNEKIRQPLHQNTSYL